MLAVLSPANLKPGSGCPGPCRPSKRQRGWSNQQRNKRIDNRARSPGTGTVRLYTILCALKKWVIYYACFRSSACEKQEPACDHSSGLFKEDKKEIARQLVSAAEYTTLVWKGTYSSIAYNVELDEAENRGYTAGIIGFTSKYSDLLAVVERFSENKKENLLNKSALSQNCQPHATRRMRR